MAPTPAPQQYPQAPVYGAPNYPQPHQQMQPPQPQPQPQTQHQSGGNPPNLANLITSLDGPALQKLLGAMSQTPQTPSNPHQPPPIQPPAQQSDLSALLQSASRQQPSYQAPQQGYGYGGGPPQLQNTYGGPVSTSPYGSSPGFSPQSGNFGGRPPNQGYPPSQQQQQPVQQNNVQDMLAQLARYQQ